MTKRLRHITVEHHPCDGFTLWSQDDDGYLIHRRYIYYGEREARRLFRKEFPG